MQANFNVSDFTRIVSKLELRTLGASGVLNPRLFFYGEVSLMEEVKELRLEFSLRLEYQNELVGESRPLRKTVGQYGSQVPIEIVTSQRLLRHITDGLPSNQSSVQIDAQLQGVGWFLLKPIEERADSHQLGSDPEPGEWKEFELRHSERSIRVERSEWYQSVLTQTKGEQYRFLEIALPRSDGELAREWADSIQHLQNAEHSYAIGDDATVFNHLRGALDALPGAKQKICESIDDERKRTAVDKLVRGVGEYLHLGRHVSQSGENAGTFPVDRLDAAFAIDLMRTTLSHLSLILAAEVERAKRDA